jgi:hypothetical protein
MKAKPARRHGRGRLKVRWEALERFIAEYVPRYKQTYKETTRARALQRRTLASRIMATIRSKDIADFIRKRATFLISLLFNTCQCIKRIAFWK